MKNLFTLIFSIAVVGLIAQTDNRDYLITAANSAMMTDAEAGIDYTHEGFIINKSIDPIISYDVVMTEGANSWTKSYTGVDIKSGDAHKYKMDESVIVAGSKEYTVTITNVNGDPSSDVDQTDNSDTFVLNEYTKLHPDRGVLAEEATGTWCPWCPAGTVYMDEMSKRFPNNFIGVAVHNQDNMVEIGYNAAITSFPGFTGFPQVVVQRVSVIPPSNIPNSILPMMNIPPPAALSVGAEISGNLITTSLQVDFLNNVSGAFNVAIIITEDGVTGTDADLFYQLNNYSFGQNGEMGGYEILPYEVPAAFNEFNHVGRKLVSGFKGTPQAIDANSYTAGMTDGWVFTEAFLPSDVDMNNLHIIGILTDRISGAIMNATQASISDAVANGLFDNTSTRDVFDANLAKVYPNPITDAANIVLNLDNAADVNITIINSLGQAVATRSYGQQSGSVTLQQDMSSLAAGMYMINITAGDRFITKKVNKVN